MAKVVNMITILVTLVYTKTLCAFGREEVTILYLFKSPPFHRYVFNNQLQNNVF